MENEPVFDTYCTSEITCPYCGFEDGDSFEMVEDEGEDHCGGCGKSFFVSREITITYTTNKIENK